MQLVLSKNNVSCRQTSAVVGGIHAMSLTEPANPAIFQWNVHAAHHYRYGSIMANGAPPEIPQDGPFSIKVSESMELRNILRSGLVEAQGRNTDKVPIFVSWPSWLEDGIVCMYAGDLHALLRKAIEDTTTEIARLFGYSDVIPDAGADAASKPSDTEEADDPARSAARAILERPLDRKNVETPKHAAKEPHDRKKTGKRSISTRDLADKLLQLAGEGGAKSPSESADAGVSEHQEVADSLFKKYREGKI